MGFARPHMERGERKAKRKDLCSKERGLTDRTESEDGDPGQGYLAPEVDESKVPYTSRSSSDLPKETPADPNGRTGCCKGGSTGPARPRPSGDAAGGRTAGDSDGLVEGHTPYQVKHTLFCGVLELVMYAN
ncbi:hypothetical protein E5288_WYG012044 [Bos mutus]|uniref:Uncharacterized protein n=1 Tax=Bos mutus TaxID=72004 RepID=A0A6B0R5A3_9CETA|nr:hypothetical protein [Bos mutus]